MIDDTALARLREAYLEARQVNEAREEALWTSLSYEQRLDLFCAVVRRIHKAELVDKGSYRYALYTVFGFDLDSYGRGMDCGYLDIHNAIVVSEDIQERTGGH